MAHLHATALSGFTNAASVAHPSTCTAQLERSPRLAAGRRASKLVSLICSCFTGNYVRQWGQHLLGSPLQATPVFDARAVLYPSDRSLRDYLSWRQADTHINNQVINCPVQPGDNLSCATR